MSDYNPDKYIYMCSIDVGVKNLGMALIELHKNYIINQIIWFDCIDITAFVHDEDASDCKLFHEKMISDYLTHVFHMYKEMFDCCSHILIERQPLEGYKSVEQLFVYKFRNKIELISPNSVHAYFKYYCDYEERKIKSINRVLHILKHNTQRPYLVDNFDNLKRQHDVSDCINMAYYWSSIKYEKNRKEIYEKELMERINNASGIEKSLIWLEQFKC